MRTMQLTASLVTALALASFAPLALAQQPQWPPQRPNQPTLDHHHARKPKKPAAAQPPVWPPQKPPTKKSPWEGRECSIGQLTGTCKDIADCTGEYAPTPWHCGGPTEIQCCTHCPRGKATSGLCAGYDAGGNPTTDDHKDQADKAEKPEKPEGSDRGAFVIGGKFGAQASINGLKPGITGALQIGYVLPFFRRQLGFLVDVSYAQPVASQTEADPRVAGGQYTWHLVQQQLTVMPAVYYRATMLPNVGPGKFVPYVGIGPRIFLVKSHTDSAEGTSPVLLESTEPSLDVGVGVPFGTEYDIGPGAVLVEGLFGWAKVAEQMTGDANLGAFSVWAGYRFML